MAQTSGRGLLTLIDGILDPAKIEAGKVTLENLSFDPRSTVEDVVQLLTDQARAKGIHLESNVSPEISSNLRGDAHRLRQVLTNLCANAIKFTERGEVTLKAALENQCDGTATLRFTITDTGIGIRPDRVAALFSLFTQADDSTTSEYGGTGLELAISRHLAEMMGGTIGVESREGQGSTFWFTAVFDIAIDSILMPKKEPRSVSGVAMRDPKLCEMLALLDAIRDGRAREREIAVRELTKRIRPSMVAENNPTSG